jgi:hypothetical protein
MANFVIFAAWSRYFLQAFHSNTHNSAIAGLSWIALSSVAVFALGLLLIRWRNLLLRFLLPAYLSIAVVAISGLANGAYSGIISVTVKYGYFIVVTLGVFEALERLGERFMSKFLWAFSLPLVLQFFSLVLGISKGSDADGSASYLGGYDSEAGFSVVLATCFVVACFAEGLGRFARNALLLLCLIAIYFANYRTTIVAMAPLAITQFSLGIVGSFRRDQRMAVATGVLVLALIGIIAAGALLQERFKDLKILAEPSEIIKPPETFTLDDNTMSGRPRIWSGYVYGYIRGGALQHLVGFGPESWADVFPKYAHNTLISCLYEYGPVGVIILLYLWVSLAVAAWNVGRGSRAKILAAHVSFFLLNMATMPMWMIEGNILYGVICGYTLYRLQEHRISATQEPWQSGRRVSLPPVVPSS